MAAVKLTDFLDIYSYCLEQLKIPSTDTVTLNRIKRDINSVYINKVAPFKRWPWLTKRVNLVHEKFYDAAVSGTPDTASVIEGSPSVTLSNAIPAGNGSKASYFFAVNSYSEIYEITSHTAGSASITLSSNFTGSTNSATGFKVWTDKVALPIDARETFEAINFFRARPMIPRGPQKLTELSMRDFRRQDRPVYYSTDDFFDPTSGTPETEADRYRVTRVWPALYDKDTTIRLSYIQEVPALDSDGDEPLMPIEDRLVIVYGALSQSWIRDRNEELAAANKALFDEKLTLMAGRIEDSLDMPRIEIADDYLHDRRNSNYRRRY